MMLTNQQTHFRLKTSLILFFSLLFSFNLLAVKKSTLTTQDQQVQETNSMHVVKKEKANFFERVSSRILTKRLKKKVAKYNPNAEKEEGKKKKGLAIVSLIFGILAMLCLINLTAVFFAIIFGLLALLFGNVARKKAINEPEKYSGKKMAIAGMILGGICLGIVLLLIIASLSRILGLFG